MAYNILVAEDDPQFAKLLRLLLESLGHGCQIASDGEEALTILAGSAKSFDVVLSDIQMPKLDGLELLRQLRNKYPHLPVALMTAYGEIDTAIRALRFGAADFIPKPFDADDLSALLSRLRIGGIPPHPLANECTRDYSEHLELRMGSDSQQVPAIVANLRARFSDLLSFHGVSPQSVSLCIHEALLNAVVHGNLEVPSSLKDEEDGMDRYYALLAEREADPSFASRQVHLSAHFAEHKLQFNIRDQGPGFDFSALAAADSPAMTLAYGRGLSIIRAVMDEVSWTAPGNEIHMRISLGQSGSASAT